MLRPLVEAAETIGLGALGTGPRPAILAALAADRIEVHLNTRLKGLTPESALLPNGELIPTATVVLTTGMRASPLAATLAGAEHDALGRLKVDRMLRVEGATNVFAAGISRRSWLTRPIGTDVLPARAVDGPGRGPQRRARSAGLEPRAL